jgi:hypothetical protein
MLIVGHVHHVPSLRFNPILLRLYTHLCNNVVYARVLAVCTMCQAWPSNSLAWALKQASGSMELRFCDQDLFKPQLAFPHPHEGLGTETPWAGQ